MNKLEQKGYSKKFQKIKKFGISFTSKQPIQMRM